MLEAETLSAAEAVELVGSSSMSAKVAHDVADTWLTDVTKVMAWTSWRFDTAFQERV